MGQEIQLKKFIRSDFSEFENRLHQETEKLSECHEQVNRESTERDFKFGLELEAWIIDNRGNPNAINHKLFSETSNTLIVPELSKYNIEFNTTPLDIQGSCFSKTHLQLQSLIAEADRILEKWNSKVCLIGTLPTLKETDLNLEQISAMQRYKALNEQIMKMRRGAPLFLNIRGEEHLRTSHYDVMLEAATTSLQIHLQPPAHHFLDYFNATELISPVIVALSANSPFAFGKNLWAESRIPIFEQAVSVADIVFDRNNQQNRVGFAHRYLDHSVMEIFQNNLNYPVLLPILFQESDNFSHLKLHNGTIWRWNRPLISDTKKNIRFRIEHRVCSSGPTLTDSIANVVFYIGAVKAVVDAGLAFSKNLNFKQIRKNFYLAARKGLNCSIAWPVATGKDSVKIEKLHISEIVREILIPAARESLLKLQVDSSEIDHYLDVIALRIKTHKNGANWQQEFMKHTQGSFHDMVLQYSEYQRQDKPIATWNLS